MEELIIVIGPKISDEYVNKMIDKTAVTPVEECPTAVPRTDCCVK